MVPANECVTLQDYRQRYALYMTDKDLAKLRQVLPWIAIADDHEVRYAPQHYIYTHILLFMQVHVHTASCLQLFLPPSSC